MGGSSLGNVRPGGSHECPPVLNGIGVGQDHGEDGTTGHVAHQTFIKEFPYY